LHQLAQPGGTAVGVDFSPARVDYATKQFGVDGLSYVRADALQPLSDLGRFDLAWIRFLLEYFREQAFQIARNAYNLLEPGGTLCLLDLDHNCLSYYGGSARLERTMQKMVLAAQEKHGFDPYVGRKLYAYLYDLGCEDIEMRMVAHHLIYGELSETDRFNWLAKAEAVRNIPDLFALEYQGGYQEFLCEFTSFLEDRRRFIYTPLIMCKGKKPLR
jgi:SAM-dependent methyltransferase